MTLSSMLHASGLRVGCFTSPHLFSIHERFRIDGVAVDDPTLSRHWDRVEAACDAYQLEHPADVIGGFEFLYLVALAWFEDCEVDFAVFECGIGGRYDPTRLGSPSISCVVSVDLEHTQILGDTLEEIACDKIDACGPGGVVWLGDSLVPLAPLLQTYCRLRQLQPRFVVPGQDWEHAGSDVQRTRLRVRLCDGWALLDAPLPGEFQCNNLAIAALMAERVLMEEFGRASSAVREAIVTGADQVAWPGRMEVLAQTPLVVIDVGHTPRAVRMALQALQATADPSRMILVCGVSVDKNAAQILDVLAPHFGAVICTRAGHKGRPAAEIARIAIKAAPQTCVHTADTVVQACAQALELARQEGMGIYVAGGLFLATEFKSVFEGRDPASLNFF
jgi:dihydrofolate synthase/folylpolyglutamate synthase